MTPELMRDIHGMKEDIKSLRQQLELARKETDSVVYAKDVVYQMLEEAGKENEEQARLLGMSAERETKLLAQLSERERSLGKLAEAIRLTLDENGHLADGDVCTLKRLKDALAKVGADSTVNYGEIQT